MVTVLLVTAAAAACAVVAGAVMTWASNRSALWNMAFGTVLALAAIAAALLIAFLMTRAAYPD